MFEYIYLVVSTHLEKQLGQIGSFPPPRLLEGENQEKKLNSRPKWPCFKPHDSSTQKSVIQRKIFESPPITKITTFQSWLHVDLYSFSPIIMKVENYKKWVSIISIQNLSKMNENQVSGTHNLSIQNEFPSKFGAIFLLHDDDRNCRQLPSGKLRTTLLASGRTQYYSYLMQPLNLKWLVQPASGINSGRTNDNASCYCRDVNLSICWIPYSKHIYYHL